jgi:hypothetical protein
MKRLALVLALLVGFLVLSPGVAGADCKTPPAPEMPGTGFTSLFVSAPPVHPSKPATRFDTYGYAGLSWDMYDDGCGGPMLREPSGTIGTTIANWIFDASKTIVSASVALTNAVAHPSFLKSLDPLVSQLEARLHGQIYLAWLLPMLALSGLLAFAYVRRNQMGNALTSLGWTLLVMGCTAVIFAAPLALAHAADNGLTKAIGFGTGQLTGSTSADPSETFGSLTEDRMLYPFWLQGEFGTTSSPSAQAYGARLYADKALPWSYQQKVEKPQPIAHVCEDSDQLCIAEHPGWKVCTGANCAHPTPDPAKLGPMDKRQADWKSTADKIKGTDPTAYAVLTGHNSDPRIAASIFSLLTVLCSMPFILASSLLVLAAFVIVRVALMFAPIIALVSLPYRLRHVAQNAGRTTALAVVNAAVFWVLMSVAIVVVSYMFKPATTLHPGDGGWTAILFAGLFTWAMWTAFKPLRRIAGSVVTSRHNYLAAGADAVPGGARKAGGHLKTAALAYMGMSYFARKTADETAERVHDTRDESERKTNRAESQPARSPGAYSTAGFTEPIAQPETTGGDVRGTSQRLDRDGGPIARSEAAPSLASVPVAPAALPAPNPQPVGEGNSQPVGESKPQRKGEGFSSPADGTNGGVFDPHGPTTRAENGPMHEAELVDGAYQVSPVYDPNEAAEKADRERAEAAKGDQ